MPTVLLVEDTPEMQRLYQMGLQHEGYTVEVAATAGEAMARVEGTTYDYIILDLMLGGMSGLDFLKQSGVRFKAPLTKIVVLTQIDSPEVMERVKAEGVDGYLIKADTEPSKLVEYMRSLNAPAAPEQTPPPVPPAN